MHPDASPGDEVGGGAGAWVGAAVGVGARVGEGVGTAVGTGAKVGDGVGAAVGMGASVGEGVQGSAGFGDGLLCGVQGPASPMHFSGKKRRTSADKVSNSLAANFLLPSVVGCV